MIYTECVTAPTLGKTNAVGKDTKLTMSRIGEGKMMERLDRRLEGWHNVGAKTYHMTTLAIYTVYINFSTSLWYTSSHTISG